MPSKKNDVKMVYAEYVNRLYDIKCRLEQLTMEIDNRIGEAIVLRDSEGKRK